MNKPPQNIYDDLVFFNGYKTLRETDSGLNGALEFPALLRLLPDLKGLRILDLGCGFGHFARYASSQQAVCVVAVDISERMLAEAKKLTNDAAITYELCAIEAFAPQSNHFDLVTSSLALHYVEDYAGVLGRVFQALKSGGKFIFSVEHPIPCAPLVQKVGREAQKDKLCTGQ
jgi:ubiquinone/menaquinone biosynthesis C-methylase UbiE